MSIPETGEGESFEARLSSIVDELSLGLKWERPSLILAIYRSAILKNKAQSLLQKTLQSTATPVYHYQVDREHYDIPIDLRDHPGHGVAIYFIEGLSRGGGRGYSNAYRALNMHREYLVEAKVKALFWLTAQEARQLPRFAPDFWAFRHKVVEFYDLPADEEIPSDGKRDNLQLLSLDASPEFQSRVASAARLHKLGCNDEAALELRQVLRLCPHETALRVKIAEIQLFMGHVRAASQTLKKTEKRAGEQPGLLKEMERLKLSIASTPSPGGGFQERSAGEP